MTVCPVGTQLWCSLLLPHLSSSLTDSLPSLDLLCHSKTDTRFMQDAPKVVWSIPYVSVAFFQVQNRISSKVSDCIFENHQLWQQGFSRVYSNCCCSCSFEPEIIKIGQSCNKIYSNNILNFLESATILNGNTKNVWNLIVYTPYIYIYIYMCVCVCVCVCVCLCVCVVSFFAFNNKRIGHLFYSSTASCRFRCAKKKKKEKEKTKKTKRKKKEKETAHLLK